MTTTDLSAEGTLPLTSLSVPDTSGLTSVGDYFMVGYIVTGKQIGRAHV